MTNGKSAQNVASAKDPSLAARRLAEAAGAAATRGLPPVHLWNPPFCGAIDMRIKADGSWHYMGTPIARPAMVRLFATILRRDPEGFMLVTPVEKVAITVDDAPFTAVEMRETKDGLKFRTNVDDEVLLGPDHGLRIATGPDGGFKPYLHVRAGLEALLTRPLALDLVERAEEREIDGVRRLALVIGNMVIPLDGREAGPGALA